MKYLILLITVSLLFACKSKESGSVAAPVSQDSLCIKTTEFLKEQLVQMKAHSDSLQDELNKQSTASR
jgi:hypothetical protein